MDQGLEFLTKAAATAPTPELKALYGKLTPLYEQKLWHPLTTTLEEILRLPGSGPALRPLYTSFVSSWEGKMRPLSLVRFAVAVAATLSSPSEAVAFLNPFLDKVSKAQDAWVLASVESAAYSLRLGNLEACKTTLDACEKILETSPGLESVIHAAFYRVCADYDKAKAAYPQYYHHALLYLSSVSLEELSVKEKQERAYELALSALLGEGLYNFGKLLLHPILDSLVKTPLEWLRTMLFQFNKGDMVGFEQILKSKEFASQPLLVSSLAFLRQKLCLMTLIEVVFSRSKESRGHMTFSDIATETRIPIEEVEHLVMKALSLGLLKGYIDQIDQVVMVSWVQPRILDKAQVLTLRDRLAEWSAKVDHQVKALEESGFADVFVQ